MLAVRSLGVLQRGLRRAQLQRALLARPVARQSAVATGSSSSASSSSRSLVTSSRARMAAEEGGPHPAADAKPQKPKDALVMTPYEKVSATATTSFWLGLLGLGCVGVYFVMRELMPSRMSPNGLFSETLDVLSQNTDVTTRLGMPIHGYGHDHGGHREGRRNRIEHVELKDKEGNPRLRIKYNIKGPTGHAYVFCEVNKGMPKGEYVYLIVQFTKTGEVIKLVDNRQILQAESKEEQDALRQLLGGSGRL